MTASSNSAKSSPYHRFIPREEVQDASPWEFQSMDGKPRKGSAAAEPVPEAPPELPAPDLELIKKQWHKRESTFYLTLRHRHLLLYLKTGNSFIF